MSRLPAKCCRSSPRCAGCPVVLARRATRPSGPPPDLVTEILLGGTAKPLPRAVAKQLVLLDGARARPRVVRAAPSG